MITDQVRRTIEEHGLIEPGARVVVGVSGGVDSVVLLRVLLGLGYDAVAAHVNYTLRGAASDGDEAFVRALCSRLGVPCHVARFDTAAEAHGNSVQATARALRYDFFARLAAAYACRAVAVAHHMDDQAETVLLNLFRGTGLEGLAGMPVRRRLSPDSDAALVRPFLGVRRSAIEALARGEGWDWRTDASNAGPKYRRSVLRTQFLPLAEEHFGAATPEHIAQAAGFVRAYLDGVWQGSFEAAWEACAGAGEGALALAALRALDPAMRGRVFLEALRRWLPGAPAQASTVAGLEALMQAQVGGRVALLQGTVWREREHLVFRTQQQAPGEAEVRPLPYEGAVGVPGGVVVLRRVDGRPSVLDAGDDTVYVDAERVAPPLLLRPWRPGDRLQPLGMNHRKKVSDLLTERKVPSHERADIRVVCSGEDIVWVVRHRLDHRVRIRPETRSIAKIEYIPAPNEKKG